MKIATVGLIALVLFLSTVTAHADSSEYIQDDDGCWYSEGPTCVAHGSFWEYMGYEEEGPHFISRYGNGCGLRIVLKACHQANNSKYKKLEDWIAAYPALANSECEIFALDHDQGRGLVTYPWHEPTGRVEFRWIGSTIAENDGLCADKSGVNDWWPNW